MAVEHMEKYRQKNGEDVLKVILEPTKVYPKGYFYCDSCDEELVKQYSWFFTEATICCSGYWRS